VLYLSDRILDRRDIGDRGDMGERGDMLLRLLSLSLDCRRSRLESYRTDWCEWWWDSVGVFVRDRLALLDALDRIDCGGMDEWRLRLSAALSATPSGLPTPPNASS
jgi:hypothetical protein